MSPSSFLFLSTTIMGTMMALSSTNWLYVWMGMELNLLSFIPLIAASQLLQETEASVKYFIIQAIGSGLMLTSGVMAMNACLNSYSLSISNTMLLISMILKLGMAPFHHWLPHVMSSMSWMMCMMLATIQKIGPMCLLIMILPKGYSLLMLMSMTMSALVGGIGGLNQTQLRPLLAYSSIGHMGWIMTTAFCSMNLFMFYFMTYITISVTLMTIMINENYMKTNLSNIIISMNPLVFLLMMLTMFSLGGLPPLLGFIPKWMIITELSINMMVITTIMIMGSLLNLFYYFNMTFNFILSMNYFNQVNKISSVTILLTSMCTVSPIALIL